MSERNPIVELGYMEEQITDDLIARRPMELERHWEQKFGTDNKRVAKARKMRQEVIRDAIAGRKHHEKFSQCIDKIEAVDVETPTASLEIYKWSKAAELHQRAMNKYVPDMKAVEVTVDEDTKAGLEGVSRAMEVLGRIAGARRAGNHAGPGQERPVVPAPVSPEGGLPGEGSQT